MAHECLEKRGITDKRPRRASFLGKQISESTEAAVVPPGEFDRRAKPSLTFADLSDTSPFPGHHRACGAETLCFLFFVARRQPRTKCPTLKPQTTPPNDRHQDTRADEYLAGLGFVAKVGCDVGNSPDGGIVEASFKADVAERGISVRYADAKANFVAELTPFLSQHPRWTGDDGLAPSVLSGEPSHGATRR